MSFNSSSNVSLSDVMNAEEYVLPIKTWTVKNLGTKFSVVKLHVQQSKMMDILCEILQDFFKTPLTKLLAKRKNLYWSEVYKSVFSISKEWQKLSSSSPKHAS